MLASAILVSTLLESRLSDFHLPTTIQVVQLSPTLPLSICHTVQPGVLKHMPYSHETAIMTIQVSISMESISITSMILKELPVHDLCLIKNLYPFSITKAKKNYNHH